MTRGVAQRVGLGLPPNSLSLALPLPCSAQPDFALSPISSKANGATLPLSVSCSACPSESDSNRGMINLLPCGRMGSSSSALKICTDHRGGINWISLSPDGQWLLTGSEDGTARLWSTANNRCQTHFQATPTELLVKKIESHHCSRVSYLQPGPSELPMVDPFLLEFSPSMLPSGHPLLFLPIFRLID
ncbi:WD repeat-containing protein 86, partial [Ophiophagus hannah]